MISESIPEYYISNKFSMLQLHQPLFFNGMELAYNLLCKKI